MVGNGERTSIGGRRDYPVRLATAVGGVAGAVVALLLRRDLGSFWLGMAAFTAVLAAGLLLGRLVGGLLFRPSSGGPQGHTPQV